ncbi:MAG: acyl carrier protein [Verrucomicrobiota bacterium]
MASVDREVSFFDQGGNSLLMVQVLNRLRSRVSPALRINDTFRYPTVASLAEFLLRERGRSDRPVASRTLRASPSKARSPGQGAS